MAMAADAGKIPRKSGRTLDTLDTLHQRAALGTPKIRRFAAGLA